MSNRYVPLWVSALIAVVGVVCLVIGVIYIAEPANSLPGFFPGHQAGLVHHHSKHGIAAIILGLGLLAASWISTGTKGATANPA